MLSHVNAVLIALPLNPNSRPCQNSHQTPDPNPNSQHLRRARRARTGKRLGCPASPAARRSAAVARCDSSAGCSAGWRLKKSEPVIARDDPSPCAQVGNRQWAAQWCLTSMNCHGVAASSSSPRRASRRACEALRTLVV